MLSRYVDAFCKVALWKKFANKYILIIDYRLGILNAVFLFRTQWSLGCKMPSSATFSSIYTYNKNKKRETEDIKETGNTEYEVKKHFQASLEYSIRWTSIEQKTLTIGERICCNIFTILHLLLYINQGYNCKLFRVQRRPTLLRGSLSSDRVGLL